MLKGKINNKPIFVFVSLLFLLILTKYVLNLTKESYEETFVNQLEKEERNYLKYEETLLDNSDQNIEELYKSYSGEGNGKKEWKYMNLHQCIDRCNRMENCIGFSREDINDDEKGSCFPKNILSKCHSSRKGNFEQRQNAMMYNTYIKDCVENQMTKCIGNEQMTLDRVVLIKPYAHPNKYIGLYNNKVKLVDKNTNPINTFLACKFKIVVGLEGSGTISFKHVETGKHLYRDNNDILVCKKIDQTSTDERQRSSFYLHDGLSNQITISCMLIRGEKMSRSISCDRKGRLLKIVTDAELNKFSKKYLEYLTFDIVDYISNNKIIKTKEMLTDINKMEMKEGMRGGHNIFSKKKLRKETFKSSNSIDEDRMELYQYLDSGIDKSGYTEEILENNETNRQIDIGKFKSTSDIDSSFNKILDSDKSEDFGESVYDNAVKFNKDLFDSDNGIMAKTKYIKNKINKSFHNLDKMKMQDMSRDYFYLKNVVDGNLDGLGNLTSQNVSDGSVVS